MSPTWRIGSGERLRIALYASLLLPTRIVSLFLSLLAAWIVSSLGLMGVVKQSGKPLAQWRRWFIQVYIILLIVH